ncbi:helix-turn-helix domain-containing protein [Halobiforma nitratireducens]|uniref:Uncharacterized protein n=1 Tax=Halobiforma nitratireducens JCM 10879 TaxID=1227454 RepID=M0L7N6_9EURY|nr:hypothetical protein [Halobiforma nitratireducens]EMA28484.1 hypothetical protein C446_17504 [Halobiforma nitratireducens JCM 10879]
MIEEHGSEGILTVDTECESPFGEAYDYETKVDVLEVRENLSQLIRKSEEEKIRKAVEGIESNLDDIESGISQQYQDAQAYQDLHQVVLKIVESEGEIGFEDLKGRVGIKKDSVLSGMINRMQRAGLVDYPDDEHLRLSGNVEIEWVGGSYDDVDKNEIGGASGKEIMQKMRSNKDGAADKEEKDQDCSVERKKATVLNL